jgi:hypothetical protein
MKRTSLMMKALLLGASLFPFALPQIAQAVTVDIVSDKTWKVYDTNGLYLGDAQNVCLNAGAPSNCPPGAELYGYFPGGWTETLSSTPQASWIWAPNITGASVPADGAEFSFKKDFYICGTPQDSTIWVAADNAAEVILNGTSVLNWNSHSVPGSVNIPAASLNQSPLSNTIEIKVKNGANPSDCGSREYRCNPAGVIFGAHFADSLTMLPKCPGNADVGTSIPLCTPPQTGKFRICACVAGGGYWLDAGSCMSPPPTCTGYTFSAWSTCGTNGQQTRTITGNTPAGCTGTPSAQPVLTQACTFVPPTCTDFTYSAWGACQPGNTQTRTVLMSSPAGCTGGTPQTTQSCTYVPPLANVGDKCWDYDRAVRGEDPNIASCPSGTQCKPRKGCRRDCFLFWCKTICDGLVTVDSFCDP